MSPATVGYPPQDIKVSNSEQKSKGRSVYQLLEDYKHFSWADKDYDLSKFIGEGAKISAVVGSIDPKQKTGGALYHRLRRLLNSLVTENLVTVSGNWSYGDALERPGNGVQPSSTLVCLINRMQNSNHFANSIPEGWKAVVDSYLSDDALNAKVDPCKFCTRPEAWRDPAAVAEHTQPERCRGCTRKNRKAEPESPCEKCGRAKNNRDLMAVRRSRWCASCPVGITRTWKPNPCGTCTFWKNKICTTQKTHCPYRLSVCSRSERKNAAWKLRAIDGRWGKHHWMFVRKKVAPEKEIVQPALTKRIQDIQTRFTSYVDDCKKRVIILRRTDKPNNKSHSQRSSERRDMVEHLCTEGNELVLDYQTRWTDEGRIKEEIKKYHDAWKEAGKNFDGAVFLTLTSDPASNDSLWDVNRHFAPALDDYIQLLTKRFRAKRRDELIENYLYELKKYEPSRWETINHARAKNRDEVNTQLKKFGDLKCKKCTRLLTSRDYSEMKKARHDHQESVFRIERKLNPYLGLTRQERYPILADLHIRTLPDGRTVKETYRPVYLAVYEFMENGLLHAHIMIFGTTWIDHMDQIKEDWDRLGQGAMAKAYGSVKNPATGIWEWIGKAPDDARNRKPLDYLIKYLIKGLYTKEGHGLYWAFNKRFFTRSQSLDSGWIDYSDGKSVWELLASLHEDQIPMSIKKQQRGAPVLKAWYDALGWGGGTGPGVPA